MSHSATNAAEQILAARLEEGIEISRSKVAAAVATAAMQLVNAGVHEGRFQIAPKDAMLAAASVYQMAYDSAAMHALMQRAAKATGVRDAYLAMPVKLK